MIKLINLNGTWDFTYSKPKESGCPELPSASAYLKPKKSGRPEFPPASDFTVKARVPAYWDEQYDSFKTARWRPDADMVPAPDHQKEGPDKLTYLRGTGWYRKSFSLRGVSLPFSVLLDIKEIVSRAHVWVNGEYAGCVKATRTAFVMDITRYCKPDAENDLVLAVGNDYIDTISLLCFQGYCGGIIGGIGLRIAGIAAIKDVFVRAGSDLTTVELSVEFSIPIPNSSGLAWRIKTVAGAIAAQGKIALPAGKRETHWSVCVPSLKPWAPAHPHLYIAEIDCVVNGKISDRFSRRFGMRKWSYDGLKLKLNGNPFFIRANCKSTHFPKHCLNPLGKDFYVREIKTLRSLGFNTLKFLFMPPPLVCLEAADELGMVVQVSVDFRPIFLFVGQKDYIFRARSEMAGMVRTIRNYLSVAIYRLSGEMFCGDDFIGFLSDIRKVIKKADPGALVLPCHALWGVEYAPNLADKSVLAEPFPHNADRLRRLLKCADVTGNYPNGILSYDSPGDSTWRKMDKYATIYDRPLLSHEIGMKASYLDLRNEKRHTNRFPPIYYRRLREDLTKNGILDRAPAYYRASCRVQQTVRKYTIEEARMCRSLAGYEYLGCTDHFAATQSYPCGFMNEFDELKPGESPAQIRRYQADTVLLLDFDDRKKRSFRAGDQFSGVWMLSHYGTEHISRAVLRWSLTDGTKPFLCGTEKLNDLPRGEVVNLTSLALHWPEVSKPVKLKLKGELSASGVKTANDWDFWVFPRREPATVKAGCDKIVYDKLSARYKTLSTDLQKHTLRIVSGLTNSDLAHMESGGDILLLGSFPFRKSTLFHPLATGHSSLARHHVGTLIHAHPVFRGFPHEEFGDWQFYPMLGSKGECVIFDDHAMPFNPILEVISSDKDVRKQASMFETRVGKGRLFVFSCFIDLAGASTAWIMDSVLEYMQSGQFRPKTRLGSDKLAALIKTNVKPPVELRRRIKCPFTAFHPVPDAPFVERAWRGAFRLTSSVLLDVAGKSKAEQDYNAGAGTNARILEPSRAGKKRRISAVLRLLCDRDYLYVAAGVTAAKFRAPLDMHHGAVDQPDSLHVIYPDGGYGCCAAMTYKGIFLQGAFPKGSLAKALIRKSRNRIEYRLAVPLAPVADQIAKQKYIDVDVPVFHENFKTGLKQAIKFKMRLEFENPT